MGSLLKVEEKEFRIQNVVASAALNQALDLDAVAHARTLLLIKVNGMIIVGLTLIIGGVRRRHSAC